MSFSLVDYVNEDDDDNTALHSADVVQSDVTMTEADSITNNIESAIENTNDNTNAIASVADYEQVEEVF